MLQGLRCAVYPAPDLNALRDWYARVLGVAPYFEQPFYIGFSVGGFELGLVPDGKPAAAGGVAYWGVADVAEAYGRLLALGASAHEEPKDVGGGVIVATVLDPAGNLLGLIRNPAFDPAAVR